MSDALMLESMSPELLKVAERAQREPEGRFHSLAHLIDVPADIVSGGCQFDLRATRNAGIEQ
jgi:hypothetical protein